MLYNSDDENSLVDIYGHTEKNNLKKIAIFITSATVCFVILLGSFLLSYNKVANKEEPVVAEVVIEPEEEKYVSREHIQIAKHNKGHI